MGYQAALISLSSLSIACLIPPLAWHIKCRNLPATLLILWLIVSSIKILVDAAVWGGDKFMSAWDGKVWCDIMVRIQQGTDSGVVCAITAIALNLFLILSANDWTIAWFNHPRRKMCIEAAICLVTPVFVMATNYICMNERYVIIKFGGCEASYSYSWVLILLLLMWPLIWSVIAFVISMATIYKYFKRRKDVKDILKITDSGLNLRRFARLLIFCILIVLVMLPISLYFIISNLRYSTGAFNWGETHNPYLWEIILFFDVGVFYDRWVTCGLSYLTFLVFGLGEEAINMYKSFLRTIGLSLVMDKVDEHVEKRKRVAIGKLKQQYRDKVKLNRTGKTEYHEMSSLSVPKSAVSYDDNRSSRNFESGLPSSAGTKASYDISEHYMGEFSPTEAGYFAAENLNDEQFLRDYLTESGLVSEDDDGNDEFNGSISYAIRNERASKYC